MPILIDFSFFPQLEHRALAAKDREARDLEKKYGKKKALEIAETNFAVTLAALQRREAEEAAQRAEDIRKQVRENYGSRSIVLILFT